MTDLSLTLEHRLSAPPRRVFEAWLDPAMLMRFMTPGPAVTCPSAKTDPVEGGRFEIVMRGEARDLLHSGTYLEITPHRRMAFTWDSPFSAPGSTVTLDFTPDGDGTLLRLTHVKFANEEMRGNHEAGWGSILAALAATLEG